VRKNLFLKEELQAIEHAVERVESRFAVELVPMFANQSNDYPIAKFKSLLFGMLSGYLLIVLANLSISFAWYPMYVQGLVWIIWTLLFLIVIENNDALKRMLIGKYELYTSSKKQANEEYFNSEVSSNPDRMGILLYLSFFERQFHIVCDTKAASVISQEQWNTLSKELSSNMRLLKTSEAIIKCIDSCGELLKNAGLSSDNLPPSTVPNDLRL
jgi:putative membrane protein